MCTCERRTATPWRIQEPDAGADHEELAKNAAEVVEDLDRMAESNAFPERLRNSAGRNADAFVATVAQGIDNARRFDQMKAAANQPSTAHRVLTDLRDLPAVVDSPPLTRRHDCGLLSRQAIFRDDRVPRS